MEGGGWRRRDRWGRERERRIRWVRVVGGTGKGVGEGGRRRLFISRVIERAKARYSANGKMRQGRGTYRKLLATICIPLCYPLLPPSYAAEPCYLFHSMPV
jgi:hypothetical protein